MLILNRRRVIQCAAASGLALGLPLRAGAQATHEVQMLNRSADGQMMVFEPAFLKIEPGDTVTFVPTDKGHNSESILGMLPEGAEAWKGKINQEISVTLTVEGLYGYKCLPHYPLGMVGLIQVGDELPNLDDAQEVKHPGQAAARMTLLFENVGKGAAGDASQTQ